MTKKAKLTLEMSEKRQRLNELLGKDELTTEERAEMAGLTTRLQDLEVELRAAITEEQTRETRQEGSPEQRELRELVARCNVGNIFQAVLEHRNAEGAEAELQTHHGLAPNQIPLGLLEQRAVTPAPADVGQNMAAIISGVFPMSCAAFRGIDMPRVGVGEAVFPVLTTNATAHTPAENAAAAETTGSFSADVLSPSRIQASFFYSREDRARFAGMDSALRENLNMSLGDKLDQVVLAGAPNGLLAGNNLAKVAASAVTTFADYRKGLVYDRIDGTYASVAGDVKAVVGAATYAHMRTVYRSNNADDSALDSVMRVSGGVKVSAHVPAVASNKHNTIVRRGVRRDMVAPVWEGITLIPDEVTLAANGQIKVTAVMLHAVKVLRTAGFAKVEVQHA